MSAEIGSRDFIYATDEICECKCGLLGCASRRLIGYGAKGGERHGTGARFDRGCRCELCKQASKSKWVRQFGARQNQTREKAIKHGNVWTSAEMEIAMRDDISVKEIAFILGRTYRAVQNMRNRCRHDPKYVLAVGVETEPTP